jgi:D-amino-acid dehydrogenase
MPKHIVIIGGGVIGLCAAHYCLERGLRVTLLERNPAQRDGCSFGNAGMVTPSHFIPLAAPGMVMMGLKMMWNQNSPFYIKPRLSWDLMRWSYRFWRASTTARVKEAAPLLRDLCLASRACFEELADANGNEFGLVKQGLLMLCKTRHTLEEESHTADQANKLGISATVHDAAGLAALDPDVRMEVAGGVFFPGDCCLTPSRFIGGMEAAIARRGGALLFDREVTGFETRGKKIRSIRTKQGDIEADEVVLAGGSWSPVIAKALRLSLLMQPGKGYSLTLPNPPRRPHLCSILVEARVAVTPMLSGLRFGGTMEMSGLNERINPARVRGIIESVPRYFPDFAPHDFERISPWRGLRPCTPDGLPYLGRPARYENLIVATGHAMMGLTLAPITGRLVAQVATSQKPEMDLRLLSPDRY